MAIGIKHLGVNDIDILLGAGTDVFDNPIDPDLARRYLAHPDYEIVVAMEGDVVVGMATGLYYFHPDKPVEFFVNEVGVADSHHRRGIGKMLMHALFEVIGAKNVKYAWVGTETDNIAARALYDSVGGDGQGMMFYEFDLEKS